MTPAHRTPLLAELVCSNSLGSNLVDRPAGLLKQELRVLGSLIIDCADETSIPAGGALAVGREAFAELVTKRISECPSVTIYREEVRALPTAGVAVVATGPLTSAALAEEIAGLAGRDHLYFYDAMAPIVMVDSVDMTRAFRAGRYGRGSDDYINCPMTEEEYGRFVDELAGAETNELKEFEQEDPHFFDACLPIEVLARRGRDALAFGPLRPVGLKDPRSGARPHAVVQLRQDNVAGTLYNLVGFQTNLKWEEQKRVFSLIPGLERVTFVRFGQMHRNTFINAPAMLNQSLEARTRTGLFFAGQITGTEGYVGSVSSGYVAGTNAARLCAGSPVLHFPETTMIGALCRYVAHADPTSFQPMKANMGLLQALHGGPQHRRERHNAIANRALATIEAFRTQNHL